MLLVCIRNYTK